MVRGYLRLFGPATAAAVAGYLDAPVADIKKHWPSDLLEVNVDGNRLWALAESVQSMMSDVDVDGIRLINGYDLFMQGKDRTLLMPDESRHKTLWPVLGRPGAVLAGAEIVGVWRPKASGKHFSLRLGLFAKQHKLLLAAMDEQAELLAAHRGQSFAGVVSG